MLTRGPGRCGAIPPTARIACVQHDETQQVHLARILGDNGHLAGRILVGAAGCRISRRGLGNHVRALGMYVVKKPAINSARARAHSKARRH